MKRLQENVDETLAPPKKKKKLNIFEREETLELLRVTYSLDNKVKPMEKPKVSNSYEPIKSGIRKKYNAGPMKDCKDLLERLMNNEYAGPFNLPVDRQLVPDYYFVVKNPIDFSTIKSRFEKGQYKRIEEFRDDVYQLFTNCNLYNGPNAELTRMCELLKKQFDRHWTKIAALASAVVDTNYTFTEENLRAFKEEKKKKKKVDKKVKRKKKKAKKKKKKKGKKKKAKKITTKQKQDMIRLIPELTEEQQTRIIEIVKKHHITEEDDDGAVTLDLDAYNNSVLTKLWNYVSSQTTLYDDADEMEEYF